MKLLVTLRSLSLIALAVGLAWTTPKPVLAQEDSCSEGDNCTICLVGDCIGFVCDDGSANLFCFD